MGPRVSPRAANELKVRAQREVPGDLPAIVGLEDPLGNKGLVDFDALGLREGKTPRRNIVVGACKAPLEPAAQRLARLPEGQ